MLIVENLVKKYGKFTAVDGVSIYLEAGEIYGFVGANGAGKTTTMRIIAGLLKPTSGKVIVDGLDLMEKPAGVKAKIGYMPDFFGVYDDLKVSEYMDFYAGVYGIERDLRKSISEQLLELVNLSDKKDFYVDNLSRGMKQRLCLARSLIHDPALLILDEPASGLDPRARVEMKEILKELKNMGKTVIISSHILPELSELCTSIGIIDRGRMVVSGTVDEIMRKLTTKKILKIKVLSDPSGAVRMLKEQPLINNVKYSGDTVTADYDGNDEDLAALLKNMVNNGLDILSFTQEEGNLESVFMQVTGGGLKNAV